MRRALLLGLATWCGCASTVDLDKGRQYACGRDAGDSASQCGTDFRCGLEGYCHKTGTPFAWKCEAAADCEAQWVCGREGTCHDPKVAADYLCGEDSQCEGGWRCGFAGRCLDPSGEALGTRDDPAMGPEVLAPKLIPGPPPPEAFAYDLTGFSFRSADRLISRTLGFPGYMVVNPFSLEDGGSFVHAGPQVFALESDGLSVMQLADGGRTKVLHVGGAPVSAKGARLQWIAPGAVSVVYPGLDGGYLLANDQFAAPLVPGPSGERLHDVIQAGGCVIAVTDHGLQVGTSALPWTPVVLDGFPGCGAPVSYSSLTLRSVGPLTAIAAVRTDGGVAGNAEVALFDLSQISTEPNGCSTANSCKIDPRWNLKLGPCTACQAGGDLVDFGPVQFAGDPQVQVECRSESLGTVLQLLSRRPDGSCATTNLGGPSSLFTDLTAPEATPRNPAFFGRTGNHGQFWFGSSAVDAEPVFLDRAPVALLQGSDGGLYALADNLIGAFTALGVPVISFPDGTQAVAAVEGAADLAVTNSGYVLQMLDDGSLSAVGLINADAVDLRAPYHAAVGNKPGGSELIVSSFDTLYSGRYDGSPHPLTARLKPLPGSAVTSLALFLDEADGGTFPSAWALTTNGLFRVREESETRWRATEVNVPEGDALEVWTENGRGRLGYSDGVVLSLPSRVRLAEPLEADVVFDFLSACGQTYALGFDGVYRLAPSASGVATWTKETLTADKYTFGPDALQGGRLFERGGKIYIFTSYGGALSFSPRGGCGS